MKNLLHIVCTYYIHVLSPSYMCCMIDPLGMYTYTTGRITVINWEVGRVTSLINLFGQKLDSLNSYSLLFLLGVPAYVRIR